MTDPVHYPMRQDQGGGQASGSTIHTERYNSWNGTLEGRQAIIFRTISRGFSHILSNKWIKILIILMWLFIVFFPLMMGFFGFINLVQSPEDESTGGHDGDADDKLLAFRVGFPVSETISEEGFAVYNISVSNDGEKPDTIVVFIEHNDTYWSAGLFSHGSLDNISGNGDWGEDNDPMRSMTFILSAGELSSFHLVVIPPNGTISGKGEVRLVAQSQGAFSISSGNTNRENFRGEVRITSYTLVGHTEGSPYHFIMTTDTGVITNRSVKADDVVSFPISITNTGSEDETFVVRVNVAKKWGYRIEGVVALPENLSDSVKKGDVGIFLRSGESRNFTVFYDSPEYPSILTSNYVSAFSAQDDSVSGAVTTIVIATNIPDQDITSELIHGMFAEVFMLFALFLAAVAGSRAISEDIAQKSFTIYFSRPIKKLDYVAIKFGSVGSVLCFGTMLPVLVVYGGLIALSSVGSDYIIDHLWVWGAIILNSLIIVTVLTSLALAFSSITARRFYAAFGLVVSYMISSIISSIIQDSFNEERGSVVSIYDSIQFVGAKIFDVPNTTYHYEWTYNLLVLMIFVVVCTSVVIMKVWKTELSE